ncbi:MAG: carbohydrate porin, partial [Chthoniobacterales bacterium]
MGYQLHPAAGDNSDSGPTRLAGSYKLGGFYDSGRFEDGNGGRSNRGNQGFYAVAEQEVWRAGGETDRALAVFGR